MNLPSMKKIQKVTGILMVAAFTTICAYASMPGMELKEFAIHYAKTLGLIGLLVGGIWLIMRNRS